nr:transposase [Facklamia hominis]
MNNKIKVLKRIAYGYRNDNRFRHRTVLITRLYCFWKKQRRNQAGFSCLVPNISSLILFNI